MRCIRPSWTAAVGGIVSMLICANAALARTPYRSNPPAQPPAISQSAATPASPSPSAPATCADGQCAKPPSGLADLASADDHRYGTALDWMDTPDLAAKTAAREQKLVFLIQISGNFTRQEFT